MNQRKFTVRNGVLLTRLAPTLFVALISALVLISVRPAAAYEVVHGVLPTASPAAASSDAPSAMYCISTLEAAKKVYYSSVFTGTNVQKAENEFGYAVAFKEGLHGVAVKASCYTALSAMAADRDVNEKMIFMSRDHYTPVQLNWKPGQ